MTTVLNGYQNFTSTTGATTVLTVPAGYTWQGTVEVNCTAAEVAAGTVQPGAACVISIAGNNAIPTVGTIMKVNTQAGANAATGLSGDGGSTSLSFPLTVIAPVANVVTVQATTTQAGTSSEVNVACIGTLV